MRDVCEDVDNSVLRGNKGLLKCDWRTTRVCVRVSGRRREGERSESFVDVSLIICSEIIFLTF